MTTRQIDGTEWADSIPEFMVFQELQRRGYEPGVDFFYQSEFAGGHLQRGGLVVDFVFSRPAGLAIEVQGVYFHYGQGSDKIAMDKIKRAELAGRGITVIFVDEDAVLEDVRGVIGDALQFRDRSRLGG